MLNRVLPLVVCLAVLHSAAAAPGQVPPQAAELAPAGVEYSRQPDELVLVYDRQPGELGERDGVPRLRLYGDGRLLVHVPRYWRGAGDYELRLPPAELDRLLVFVAERLAFFDEARVEKARSRLLAAHREKGGELRYSSDPTLTRIEVRLDGLRQAGPMAPTIRPLVRHVQWLDLAEEARIYSELPGLAKLAEVAERLQVLTEDPRLERLVP